MCARTLNCDLLASPFAATCRHLNAKFIGKIPAGERSRSMLYLLIITDCNDFSTVLAGTRPKVENAVARAHHVGIVLHHQHGVSKVPQSMQNIDQTMRVAAMQPDGWLVQHVKRADQLRS